MNSGKGENKEEKKPANPAQAEENTMTGGACIAKISVTALH